MEFVFHSSDALIECRNNNWNQIYNNTSNEHLICAQRQIKCICTNTLCFTAIQRDIAKNIAL